MTQTTESTSASNAAMIAGVAMDTIVASTRIMKNPSTSAHIAGQGLATSRVVTARQ